MKMIAFETSSKTLKLAALEQGSLKKELAVGADMRHSESLAPLFQALLDSLGWRAAELGALGFSLGPGSFTGLRTGLAFAKGLCSTSGARLLGVPTLEAWVEESGAEEVLVWLDARKGMVYRGAYRRGKAVTEPAMLSLAQAASEDHPSCLHVGDLEGLKGSCSASAVGRLAWKRIEQGGSDDPMTLEPIYLRRPEAEILWKNAVGFDLGELEETDLDEVVEIEQACFGTPWSKALFIEELKQKEICHWVRARPLGAETPRIAAYMGFWKAVDEAHITNIAVRMEFRRQGLARALALHTLGLAKDLGCVRATLEVRPSNTAALKLYEGLGFIGVAFRQRYYIDNGEDALIMWKNGL